MASNLQGAAITQREPDGWQKAWELSIPGEPVRVFRFKDSVEHYLADRAEREATAA